MQKEKQLKHYLSSPLAGGARRTGKSEGCKKEKTLLSPLIGFECLRTQNHFPRQGGRQTAYGFTLIELLVVVLIIGILAAVAVPQYQKAVWKSRGAQLLVAVQALHTAQKAYYLANGTPATTFDELSIEMPFKTSCGSGDGCAQYTNNTATDCRKNKYGFMYIGGNGQSAAYFRWDSPKYRWSGFIVNEKETSQYPDELLCTNYYFEGLGTKHFCALMGWNTEISCNNGACLYRK